MKNASAEIQTQKKYARIERAFFLSMPLWASGIAFLAVLFVISGKGHFHSVPFMAAALSVLVLSVIAALHVMDKDLQHAKALQHSPEYRRMQLRARRLRNVRFN